MLLKFLACRADIAVIGFVIVEFIVIESRITSATGTLMTDTGCYPLFMEVFIILPDTPYALSVTAVLTVVCVFS